MSTFDGQPALPKLPIPPLEDTCKRYLLAVTPLLTKQELVTTTAAVERFLATDGPALQRSLCEYAADKSSYIEDFWFDAYLSGSSSVVLNINPYFVLEDDPTPSNNDQVHRAASLTMSALQFIGKLRAGTLAADDWRGTPLCMNQYRKLFGCTRVPHQEADEIVCYPESRHLVVMAKGRVYHFDAFWGDGTLCVSEGRLRENLDLILEDARTATKACAVPRGILSLQLQLCSLWPYLLWLCLLWLQVSRCSSSSSRAWGCSPPRSGRCGTTCARCSAATRPTLYSLWPHSAWPRLLWPPLHGYASYGRSMPRRCSSSTQHSSCFASTTTPLPRPRPWRAPCCTARMR